MNVFVAKLERAAHGKKSLVVMNQTHFKYLEVRYILQSERRSWFDSLITYVGVWGSYNAVLRA